MMHDIHVSMYVCKQEISERNYTINNRFMIIKLTNHSDHYAGTVTWSKVFLHSTQYYLQTYNVLIVLTLQATIIIGSLGH